MSGFKDIVVAKPTSKRERNRDRTRDALMEATAFIIADKGFPAATITAITRHAGIALGTFYNYFSSPDDIFGELVTTYGRRLREAVRTAVAGQENFFTREEIAFQAWFKFFHSHPFFLRVLNEAEIFSPDAFESYFEAITQGYRTVLTKSALSRQIRDLSKLEIETITLTLMAQRKFYSMRMDALVDPNGQVDPDIVTIYMDILRRILAR